MKVRWNRVVVTAVVLAVAMWLVPSAPVFADDHEGNKEKIERREGKAEKSEHKGGLLSALGIGSREKKERRGEKAEADDNDDDEKEGKAERKEKGEAAKVKGEAKEKGERTERKAGKSEVREAEQPKAQEEKVSLEQVSAAAREALERVCPGATVRDITKETAGGKTLYDFELTRKGRAFEFDIAANGEVLSRGEQIELDRAPATVRKALERLSKGGKIGMVMKEVEEGKTKYEAEVAIKGRQTEITVGEDGKVIAEEAQKEAEKETAGREEKRDKVKAREERGEREGGKREAGKEEREEENEAKVTMGRLPAAVRATLKRESAGGKLGEITREKEGGKVVYSADLTLDGSAYEIEIAANGKLIKKALEDEEKEEQKAEVEKPRKEKSERGERESAREKKERDRD